MAKRMTKSQARKRIQEAESKLMSVAANHPYALSFLTIDKILKITLAAQKKLK